ncbi:MAG: hypothetical protein IPN03_07660 [Holophagales bacterium]|nr:hypothetical protein [Holophagales bacterium]
MKLVDEFGFVDVDKLAREMPRLAAVKELAERHRFLHWELEFAEVFADRGGFDLIVGNPPWIKVEWDEGGVMGDFEPLFVLRGHSGPRLSELRREAIGASGGLIESYLGEFVESSGMQAFLNAGTELLSATRLVEISTSASASSVDDHKWPGDDRIPTS